MCSSPWSQELSALGESSPSAICCFFDAGRSGNWLSCCCDIASTDQGGLPCHFQDIPPLQACRQEPSESGNTAARRAEPCSRPTLILILILIRIPKNANASANANTNTNTTTRPWSPFFPGCRKHAKRTWLCLKGPRRACRQSAPQHGLTMPHAHSETDESVSGSYSHKWSCSTHLNSESAQVRP